VIFMKKYVKKHNGKWINAVIIKENGILVYKYHRCGCGCNTRIPYRESQTKNGLPEYISGHNPHGTETQFKKGEYQGFGFKKDHKPWNKDGHHSEETCDKMRESHLGTHLSEETKQKLREANSGENHPKWIDGYALERWNSKKRGKGFNPLNQKNNVSTTMHHLSDGETVIFEPKSFHDACPHGGVSKTKENIEMADEIALMWYSIEWFHLHGISIE